MFNLIKYHSLIAENKPKIVFLLVLKKLENQMQILEMQKQQQQRKFKNLHYGQRVITKINSNILYRNLEKVCTLSSSKIHTH